jgi:hypothetical protein
MMKAAIAYKDPRPLEYQEEGTLSEAGGQHIARTSNTAREMWKVSERATPKVKLKAIDVRVLYAREIFTRFFSEAKLLKRWWPGTESNRRRRPFQGRLPYRRSGLKSTDVTDGKELVPQVI